MSKDKKTRTGAGCLLRLRGVLKLIPVSKSTWWQGVRVGKFPQPVKLGERLTCWREDDIRELVERGVQS